MCDLFGTKKAAKTTAAATKAAADQVATSEREQAQQAVLQMQTTIAQRAASSAAADLLDDPVEQVDVRLASDVQPAEIDPVTQRRRTARSAFMTTRSPGAGIKLT